MRWEMANTYAQIYLQIVFAVQGRQNLIRKENKEELHKYITGIIRNKKQKLIAINSMPDHTHLFIGMKPTISLARVFRGRPRDRATPSHPGGRISAAVSGLPG